VVLGKGPLEGLVSGTGGFWRGRPVVVTGHTGFKGGWLTLWLAQLGAEAHGYALAPPTEPSLFAAARVRDALASDTRADLADLARLAATFAGVQPEVVFHLAAQPLVKEGYRDPLRTLASNVMGTAHVLEAARACRSVRAVVVVTTDKVYRNRERRRPYREADPLGGRDPYSASKAAAEIVTASYRESFFGGGDGHPARVATARSGNVIGGGDWAADRLVPDCLRAFAAGEAVRLRFPHSVRPWQHVLEPLCGYLLLAELLAGPGGERFARAWNFGPDAGGDATAGQLAGLAARCWGPRAGVADAPAVRQPHEAGLLRLDSARARKQLGWRPRWSLEESVERTLAWHRAWGAGADMAAFSLGQIAAYERWVEP
jgi:CDP-glucose 4,6-dehydratase